MMCSVYCLFTIVLLTTQHSSIGVGWIFRSALFGFAARLSRRPLDVELDRFRFRFEIETLRPVGVTSGDDVSRSPHWDLEHNLRLRAPHPAGGALAHLCARGREEGLQLLERGLTLKRSAHGDPELGDARVVVAV